MSPLVHAFIYHSSLGQHYCMDSFAAAPYAQTCVP